jgi:hypothetical protein
MKVEPSCVTFESGWVTRLELYEHALERWIEEPVAALLRIQIASGGGTRTDRSVLSDDLDIGDAVQVRWAETNASSDH